jgi:hypothetical protein
MIGRARPLSVRKIVVVNYAGAPRNRFVPAFIELIGMTDAGEAVSTNENALTC